MPRIRFRFEKMNLTSRLANLMTAALVGTLAALSMPAWAIDDTEIYFSTTAAAASTTDKPNVLFIVDNSGSMSSCVSGSSWSCTQTRMQAIQQALTNLLNSNDVYNGINAGMMIFEGDDSDSEAQPIYYPIKPLTAAASTVDSGATVSGDTTVRGRLLKIVSEMAPGGATPIVGALYEAARYLRGDTVGFTNEGLSLGVSHKASVTGGNYSSSTTSCSWSWWGGWTCTTTTTSACNSGTRSSSSPRCTTTGTPAPTYISPLTADRGTPFTEDEKEPCQQADYVILLTDGLPTSRSSTLGTAAETLIAASKGVASFSCAATPAATSGWSGTTDDGKCGKELAEVMHGGTSGDIRSSVTGKQWAITHTIAFALDDDDGKDYLEEIAAAGGGNAYTATTAAGLAAAFSEIISSAIARSAATATPTLALNAFNSIYTRDDIYLTLFDPTNHQRWAGNVKKYKICAVRDNPATTSVVEGCTVDGGSTVAFGTFLGQGATAGSHDVAVDSDGNFLVSARDFWNTGSADGSNVRGGGAGSVLDSTTKSTRKIYTFTGTYDASNRQVASGDDLTANANLLNTRSTYTCSSSTSTDNCALTPAMFNISGGLTATNVTAMNKIIKWIRDPGLDVNDSDADGSVTDYRDPNDEDFDGSMDDALWPFEDPMHAGAVPQEYGGSSTAPVTKVFVPTNGGGLRMLNGSTGAEEWMFIPKELLDTQSNLMSTSTLLPAGTRTFGLDMTPLMWIRDDNDGNNANGINSNAQIETTGTNPDFVRLFVGQRDGGRAYYSLEVTPSASLTASSTTATVNPKLRWKIEGGVTTGFTNLESTWSRPVLTKVRTPSGIETVLIFGGGNPTDAATSSTGYNYRYGTNQGTESRGNIVYIVNAETGALVSSIGGNGTTAAKKVTGMNYPIPSEITVLDTSGDGLADRMYFGDLGGNVWRVDLYNATVSSVANTLVAAVGKLADLSSKPASSVTTPQNLAANSRSFYFPPAVIQANRSDLGGRFDLIVLASGHKLNPRNGQDNSTTGNATVQNSLYAIMDLNVRAADRADDSDFPNRKTGQSGSGALTSSDLVDMSSNTFQMTPDPDTGELELSATQSTDLKTAYSTKTGWYMNLPNSGEKGVSTATAAADVLVFNTYTPADQSVASTNACGVPDPGTGRKYAVDVFTGSALYSQFDSDDTALSTADRSRSLAGMPSEGINVGSFEGGIVFISGGGGGGTDDGTGPSAKDPTPDMIDPGTGDPRGRIYWYER